MLFPASFPGRSALRVAAFFSVVVAAGCVSTTFRTDYQPLDPQMTKDWTVTRVSVQAPRSLSVSEARSHLPNADIVWREDPAGDRLAQVERIMTDAIRAGARPLKGKRPVAIEATVTRFHAMTFEAESLSFQTGVHDVEFDARIVDARTGQPLVAPTHVNASFPAMTGARMAMARSQGDSQKKQITRRVAAAVAGWLGVGPDVREVFPRLGG